MGKLGFITAAVLLSASAQNRPEFSVLVFSKTAGFRHSSIPAGVAAIQKLGLENGFAVAATEDANAFNDQNLQRFRAVVFLNTTGDVLDEAQQGAFERYIHKGGGFVGVHSATDTEYDWPFYGRLAGAYFKNHPAIQAAEVQVLQHSHPSTRDLPGVWPRADEWYNFRAPLAPGVHVLAKVNEDTYAGGEMGGDHPISWCQEIEGGRAWYTAMGHTDESYSETLFLTHLLGGIRAAAGAAQPACEPNPPPRGGPGVRHPEAGKTR